MILSTFLTGMVIVAALHTLGAASRASLASSQQARGVALANELMAEILNQAYLDPDGEPSFGVEANESSSTRSDFDDVDDYDGWAASPPQDKAGDELPNGTNWRRAVRVEHRDPDNPLLSLADTNDQGMKYVVVTVRYNGTLVARLRAGTTSAWPSTGE